jgi:hypothetical protein
MTRPRPPFDDSLEAWLDEGPTAAPADLLEAAYADIPATYQQRRPIWGAARRFPMLASSLRFAAAAAAVVLVGVIGLALLRGLAPIDGAGGSQTPGPTDVTVASPTPGAPSDGAILCATDDLALQVTSWDGAAGHRTAAVTMTNTSATACTTLALDRPQLVAGTDGATVLIDGAQPAASATLTLEAGATLSTLVQDGNYCGPDVSTGPITVAFILSNGTGRVVAEPLTPTDLSGLPPCNGNPGSAGTIDMHPWAP